MADNASGTRADYDILVLGAGPAGVVAARTLAGHGYRLELVSRPRRLPAVEGLSERALAGLRFAGCRQAVARIGPEVLRRATWNGAQFGGNREWLLERGAFDAALREDAEAAGVAYHAGRVLGFKRNGGRWSVSLADGGALTAGFLIDARGRAAPHARGRPRRGPFTIALGQVWEFSPAPPPLAQVSAFPDGWLWFARLPTGAAVLQLVVSAASGPLPSRSRLQTHYEQLLSACPETAEWLRGARPSGQVFARQAQPQFNDDLIGDAYARVGDAAFAIDPLSGHGIYEAVGGALALAATVNTLLARPQDRDLAERFYRERSEQAFQRLCRIGRDFYRQEQRWPAQPFWRERRAWPDHEPAHAPPDSAPARLERRPVNADGFIRLQEVIVTPDQPRGVWQVAGVALAPLLRYLRGRPGGDLASRIEDYAERNRLKPEDCRTALAWLVARRLVRVAATTGPEPEGRQPL